MTSITDEFMRERLSRAKTYCIMILKAGPNVNTPGADEIIWEHGRRNFMLRERGVLPIICPVNDGSDVLGVGIFNASPADVRSTYDDDPGVKAGIFVYEVHPCRSFPGDSLPN